jgi:hypothetical protein
MLMMLNIAPLTSQIQEPARSCFFFLGACWIFRPPVFGIESSVVRGDVDILGWNS